MRTLVEIDADLAANVATARALVAERRAVVSHAFHEAQEARRARLVALTYQRAVRAQEAAQRAQDKADAYAATIAEVVHLRDDAGLAWWRIGQRFGRSGPWAAQRYAEAKR